MNPFENYRQFLQPGIDSGDSYTQGNPEIKTYTHDQNCCSHLQGVIKKKFYHANYPADLASQNIFCPMCGKQVKSSDNYLIYDSQIYHRKFLTHSSCLSKESSISFGDQFDNVQEMIIQSWSPIKKMKPLCIGDRQFCIQLFVVHPLSDLKFIKLITKGILSDNLIRWDLCSDIQDNCYLPNMICFPFVDFKIMITLSQIGAAQNKTIITNYVNLSRNKSLQMKSMKAKSDKVCLEILVHSQKQHKKQVLDKMNYKYKYGEQLDLPVVEILALQIQIPQEQFQSYHDQNSSTIVKTILSEKQDTSYRSSSYYNNSVQSSAYNNSNIAYSNRQKIIPASDSKLLTDKSYQMQKQKFDFQMLVNTNSLSAYVRNNINSRVFQNFLIEKANSQQVQMVIDNLYNELHDLITDEYANYMTQKLFEVSIPTQRIKILSKLYEYVPKIVKNKHGTHTMQYFTKYMTLDQQFQLVCGSIGYEYDILCFHSISTHFIRKIVSVFPLKHTIHFFQRTNQKFLDYATDKNAMCVIKHMLLKLKEIQTDPLTHQIKKHFVNSITLNTDKIIQDCYGNYVVQFCYQLIGQAKSSGVTEMIIEKFVQFSIQKYSNSVISKCINTYWTDKSYAYKLKDSLKNQGIIQMYRNKEGNKILLDLMDNNQTTPLRDKIYNLIKNIGEPTKFYHDRWGLQKGIRSGPVGFQAKSFGEAQLLAQSYKQSTKDNTSKKSRKK